MDNVCCDRLEHISHKSSSLVVPFQTEPVNVAYKRNLAPGYCSPSGIPHFIYLLEGYRNTSLLLKTEIATID